MLLNKQNSPARLLSIIALSVFVCESFVMIFISFLPSLDSWFEVIFDSTLLLVILSPMLYKFMFRPLVKNIATIEENEKVLRKAHDELEQQVEERTKQLSETSEQFMKKIEDHRLMEEMLREGEERYKSLFENMLDGVAVYEAKMNGEDFVFKDFNRAGELIEKVKKEDLLGKSVAECFPGVKDFGLFDVFQRVWNTGKPES